MSRVGEKIKNARTSTGMSEKQLAKKIGTSENFIKDVECGRKIINESVMDKISKVLGKDLNDVTMSFEEEVFKGESIKGEQNKKPIESVKEVWNDAFSSVLKTVPIYGYDMNKVLGGRQMPIMNNKIEGHAKDKALFLKVEDEDMTGYRISKGDVAFGYITHELENDSISFVEYKGERHIRQIKRLDSSKILLISNGNTLQTQTATMKEIKVLVRLEKLEIKL